MSREATLVRTMVELSDQLVGRFDVVELLTLLADRCVEVFDVSSAGIMLTNNGDGLRVVASSSEEMRMVELFEIQSNEGPCPDAYRTGRPSVNEDLENVNGRWPRFVPVALKAGYRSVHALPMRSHGVTIGALNMFRHDPGTLGADDVVAAQALADVATISILQNKETIQSHVLNEQLQRALESRIVIERATGKLAEKEQLEMDEAFRRMRVYARSHQMMLSEVALSVVEERILV